MGKKYVTSNVLPTGAKCLRTMDLTTKQTKNTIDELFVWIDCSWLKKADFSIKRKTGKQERLRNRILKAIENYTAVGFFTPIYEPSIDANGNIQYVAGVTPEIGRSVIWWSLRVEQFCPERGSRFGTEDEYFLFIAYLLKTGVIDWKRAADNSKSIGNFWDSPNSKHSLEKTGERKRGQFYGFIGNTGKFVKCTDGYAMMGGSAYCKGCNHALADITYVIHPNSRDNYYAIPWIVLEK